MSRLRKALWTSQEICTLLNNYEKNSPGFMRQCTDWTCTNLDLGALSSELGRSEGAIITMWWRFRDFFHYDSATKTRFFAVCTAAIEEFSSQRKGSVVTLTSEEKNMNEYINEREKQSWLSTPFKYAVVYHTRVCHVLCPTKESAEKAISKALEDGTQPKDLSILYAESGITSFAITMKPVIESIDYD